jgi:hypothetical protein
MKKRVKNSNRIKAIIGYERFVKRTQTAYFLSLDTFTSEEVKATLLKLSFIKRQLALTKAKAGIRGNTRRLLQVGAK